MKDLSTLRWFFYRRMDTQDLARYWRWEFVAFRFGITCALFRLLIFTHKLFTQLEDWRNTLPDDLTEEDERNTDNYLMWDNVLYMSYLRYKFKPTNTHLLHRISPLQFSRKFPLWRNENHGQFLKISKSNWTCVFYDESMIF